MYASTKLLAICMLIQCTKQLQASYCRLNVKTDKDSKFTILRFFKFKQSVMRFLYEDFSRIRDFYIRPYPDFLQVTHRHVLNGPVIALYKLIADSINSTLISEECAEELSSTGKRFQFIQVYPKVAIFRGADYVLSTLLADIKTNTKQHFSIIPLGLSHLNFVYCDIPKISQIQEPWRFHDIFSVFELHAWQCILISATLCSVTLVIAEKKYKLTFNDFLNCFCSLLTVLISNDFGLTNRLKSHSYLLLLWTMMCLIIGNFYTAEVTTGQTLPPPEKAFTEIPELYENNYTLLYTFKPHFKLLRATVNYHLKGRNRTSDMGLLEQILNRKYFITYAKGLRFAEKLISMRKVAYVTLWHHVMTYLDLASVYKASNSSFRSVHCYIGKKLLPAGGRYHVMLASDLGNAKQKAASLLEAGFFYLWYKEWGEMRYATRVQDRKKVLSKTKVRYDFEDDRDAVPLILNDRILAVFCLLVVGLIISATCFTAEKSLFNTRKCYIILKNEILKCLICGANHEYFFNQRNSETSFESREQKLKLQVQQCQCFERKRNSPVAIYSRCKCQYNQ